MILNSSGGTLKSWWKGISVTNYKHLPSGILLLKSAVLISTFDAKKVPKNMMTFSLIV